MRRGWAMVLVEALLVALLDAPLILASTDVVAQLYAQRNTPAAARVTLPRPIPDDLQTRLQDVDYDKLSPALQRALLWDMGFVFTQSPANGSLALVRVRVPCGSTMSSVFLPNNAFDATDCQLQYCNRKFIAFTDRNCSARTVAGVSRCAVEGSVAVESKFPVWSRDGANEDIVNIRALKAQTPDAGNKTIITLNESPDGAVFGADNCPSTASFIAPCVQYTSALRVTHCYPESGVLVDLWMREELRRVAVPLTSMFAISTGVLSVLCVVLLVLLVRQRRAARSLLLLDSEKAHESTSSGIIPSTVRPQRTPLSSRDSKEVERINASYTSQSSVIEDFSKDSSLLMKLLPLRQIHFEHKIWHGRSGEIWRGIVDRKEVAIKRLQPDVNESIQDIEAFVTEIRVASMLEHANIVRLVGLAWTTIPELCMISEFVSTGSLAAFLPIDAAQKLTWKDDKFDLATDIAHALVYLHSMSPAIVHRDLSSSNILLTANYEAKLSNFGIGCDAQLQTEDGPAPLWTAPEVLFGGEYTEKADIFAFGIVLSELDTCRAPYSLNEDVARDLVSDSELVSMIAQGAIKPVFSPSCPPELRKLALACVAHDPAMRPSAAQLSYKLQSTVRPSLT